MRTTTVIQVRFNDIDMAGHVHNAVYLSFFEQARMDLLRAFIAKDHDWKAEGLILARNEVDYRKPVHLRDAVEVECWCSNIGSKSFELQGTRDPVALVEGHFLQAAHVLAPLLPGVLAVVHVVGQVHGMHGARDAEGHDGLPEHTRRHPGVRAPFQDQPRTEPAHRAGHQHQFVQREGVDPHHRYQLAEHEFGDDPVVHLELRGVRVHNGIGEGARTEKTHGH